MLDSWDAAEDSEVEREKAKKAAEVKAKAEAEAKANKKSKTQRLQEKIAERQRMKEDGDEDSEEETDAQRKERLLREQKEADLRHAEDLFGGDVGSVPSSRKAVIKGSVVPDPKNPENLIDLSAMPLFDPKTKAQFETLREVMAPIIGGENAKKAHYALFLTEFAKQLARDLPSDQIKKVASTLTTLSNEKMREEKQQGGAKKSKAAKTKTTLAISRPTATDTTAYDEETFGDDDFM